MKEQAKFLNLFFQLFDASIVKLSFENKIASGIIEFNDNSGNQEFKWVSSVINDIDTVIVILEYLINNNLVQNDRITISKNKLTLSLEETNIEYNQVCNSIESLLKVNIKMIDNGMETDSFFLHFTEE